MENFPNHVLENILTRVIVNPVDADNIKKVCKSFYYASEIVSAKKFKFNFTGTMTCVKHLTKTPLIQNICYNRVPSDFIIYPNCFSVTFNDCNSIICDDIYERIHHITFKDTTFDLLDISKFQFLKTITLEYYRGIPINPGIIEGLKDNIRVNCITRIGGSHLSYEELYKFTGKRKR